MAVVIILFSCKKMFVGVINWEKLQGWEAYFIAQAIAKGEGFSFHSTHRWLFDKSSDENYYPTAWADPLYTYSLAGLIYMFGDYHQLAAALFNLFLYIAIFILTYHLAERLISYRAAVLAVLLLAISKYASLNSYMNNSLLATSLILLSFIALVNFFELPCYRRAGLLGSILGLTILACPSALLFIPVTAISIIFWHRKKMKQAFLHSLIICIISVSIIAPWTIRNYLVFNEFVTVRTGAGHLAFIGEIAAAGTVNQKIISSNIKPAWKAKTPEIAINNTLNYDKRNLLEKFQLDYAEEVGPAQWSNMNEAQRDKWLLKEAKSFALANPLISIQLAIAKIEVFIHRLGWFGTGVMIFALIGALITLNNPAFSTMTLWVGSYAGPFLLIICYFSRYRIPIEPLLILFIVFAITWIITKITLKLPGLFTLKG